jgi:hypothetical protein
MISLRVEKGQPAAGKLVYRPADYAFATEPRPSTCGACFTINELELMVADDEERRQVVFIEGYCPYPGWRKAVLRPPFARLGLVCGESNIPVLAGIGYSLHSEGDRWPVLVDPASGWVRLGKGSPDQDRDGVHFAPGAIAVLEGVQIRALWLHPERLPGL